MKPSEPGPRCAGCGGECHALQTPASAAADHAWLDRLFLHPRWGFVGSLAVFAGVLFVVFEVSASIDAMTTARLAEWAAQWQPVSTPDVVAKAVADGLIGLAGIVVPYMIPLVLLLVALEQASCSASRS
jgi:ferrous iron transport protein B